MAKEDLIPQKMVRVTNPTHAALMRVAAAIQAKTGGYTSMDSAIQVLIEGWFRSEEKLIVEKIKQTDADLGVSLRAYIADAEANDPWLQSVVIKDAEGSLYVAGSQHFNANLFMSPDREQAQRFDNPDQAKKFLCQAGRDVEDWILEPA